MSVIVTGGHGFLGWHLRARLHAVHGTAAVALGRHDMGGLTALIADATDEPVLYHLAGVNRAERPEDVERDNVEVGHRVAEAISAAGRPVNVVYANSIQSRLDNPYGRGKAQSGHLIQRAVDKVHGSYSDVVLPNLFGEHGRPDYNSFVATFADRVAHGATPEIHEDREVPLLHAQSAAGVLVQAAATPGVHEPPGVAIRVSQLLEMLLDFHDKYGHGQIPALSSDFEVDLFNTYRSHLFPDSYPRELAVHADERGRLFETVRVHGTTGQSFTSVTNPGFTRGEHYHLRKIERFCVVDGQASIALRRLLTDEVVTFHVSGDRPTFIDMPTMWVHSITNTGAEALVTQFWTDQLLDPDAPDTYWEPVHADREVPR